MGSNPSLDDCIHEAIVKIQTFVSEVAGFEPSQTEIGAALQRYFVLKEINDHIVMARLNMDSKKEV